MGNFKNKEDAHRMIIENCTSGIYIFQDNKFVFVNKAMENLTGYTKLFAQGRFCLQIWR